MKNVRMIVSEGQTQRKTIFCLILPEIACATKLAQKVLYNNTTWVIAVKYDFCKLSPLLVCCMTDLKPTMTNNHCLYCLKVLMTEMNDTKNGGNVKTSVIGLYDVQKNSVTRQLKGPIAFLLFDLIFFSRKHH